MGFFMQKCNHYFFCKKLGIWIVLPVGASFLGAKLG